MAMAYSPVTLPDSSPSLSTQGSLPPCRRVLFRGCLRHALLTWCADLALQAVEAGKEKAVLKGLEGALATVLSSLQKAKSSKSGGPT